MKVQIKVRPTGAYNGQPWPQIGEQIELPDHVAVGMLASGLVTAVAIEEPVEQRPAPVAGNQETAVKRSARKRAASSKE